MDRKQYVISFRQDHKLSKNDYVKGRILGIAEIICELCERVAVVDDGDGKSHLRSTWRGGYMVNADKTKEYLEMYCTAEQYERFKEYVEGFYPGLLEFDTKDC